MHQIVAAVYHCHQKGLVIRDLKPEGIFMQQNDLNIYIKLANFRSAVYIDSGQQLSEVVGSAYYVCPEILRQKYDQKVDLWSCGIFAHILLFGVPPFQGDTDQDVLKQVLYKDVDFKHQRWSKVSPDAKDFVRKLLDRRVHRRPNAEVALGHDWLLG